MTENRMGSKTVDRAYKVAITNDYHTVRMSIALDMLSDATDLSGKHGFDFGCGEGTFMRLLRERGVTVSGCDLSETLLSPDATLGGVEILERQKDLDFLIALNVLSYMTFPEIERFWAAAGTAVKPGGYLLTNNPNPLAALTCNPKALAVSGPQYSFFANPLTFPAFLQDRGFAEQRQEFFRTHPPRWRRLLGDRARIIDRGRLDRMSMRTKLYRSTSYFSLSRRL